MTLTHTHATPIRPTTLPRIAAEQGNADRSPTEAPQPLVIVYGIDEAGKPHASWFGAADAELALKAAKLMGMQALHVADDECRAAALALPAGRIFASGKGFVPFAKMPAYKHLSELAEARPDKCQLPDVETDQRAEKTPRAHAASSGSKSEPAPSTEAEHRPATWDEIITGSLVLASTGPAEGWFEAVVVAERGTDLFELRWRDWPDEPLIVRRREHLALLHPDFVEVVA